MMIMELSRLLQLKAHALIPGGCHTYAKGDDQYPELAPRFIARGQGCHVWDADGNRFIEYGMGLRAVTLGHAFKPVVEAAHRQMLLGDNFTRPAPIEVACAERLLELLDGPEMVKFAKNGSDVTTAAVKLARAYTGRNMVAVCGDHPFFSVDDWFIGSTEMAAGIPQVVRDLTVKFRYNDIESVHTLFTQYPDRIACLVMEPERTELPRNGFLRQVQEACRANGALFILDEIITGFRVHLQGAQKLHGVTPDLATFGKGMGNGFSVSALVGRREVMRLGGLDHERERVFLLSNTFGAENHCLAAALATMEVYTREGVVAHLYRQGEQLARGINRIVEENGLQGYFGVEGRPSNLVFFTRDQERRPSQAFRALFMQELAKRGVLAPSFVISFSHTDEDVARTLDAVADSLVIYRKALAEGVDKYLVGRPVKPVNRKYN